MYTIKININSFFLTNSRSKSLKFKFLVVLIIPFWYRSAIYVKLLTYVPKNIITYFNILYFCFCLYVFGFQCIFWKLFLFYFIFLRFFCCCCKKKALFTKVYNCYVHCIKPVNKPSWMYVYLIKIYNTV